MTPVVVIGAAGKMGRQMVAAVLQDRELRLAGTVERPGAPEIGQDAGQLAGQGDSGIKITDDLLSVLEGADVSIEFTAPEATLRHLAQIAEHAKAAVIGTTGFSPSQLEEIATRARRIPVFLSPNMSIGVNVLLKILPLAVQALGQGYDIEVMEAHHRYKKDAPSGTALKLAEAIAQARGRKLEELAVHGRRGIAPRQEGEIGLHAMRAGGIVGLHTVLFANEGEQIEVTHRAFSRQTFALGAVRAVKFLVRQPPGLYSMLDLLAAG